MSKYPTDKILVFDIETDSLDTTSAHLRYFGAYSFIKNERFYLKGDEPGTLDKIADMIAHHDIIVGFNIKRFDIPVLNRYEIYFQRKIIVDLWEVLSEPKLDPKTHTRSGGKGRGQYMGLNLNSWTLANIVKELKLGEYKTEGFDHNLLKKHPSLWTVEEEKIIVEYLKQDITITKRLFEYTHNFFHPFTEYLSEVNVNRMTYVTASIASLAYKIICHEANLFEEYGEDEKDWEYEGGYVRYPTKEKHVGPIICFDFTSLYPSIFRLFNLFSPAEELDDEKDVFTGNDFFQVKGRYKKDKQGVVEGVIEKLFKQRMEYKKGGDKREYLIKIIINSLYGITPKPVFKSIYYRYSAEDCTSIGRQMIKYAAETFNQRGFEVLYGDTDSVYVALNDKSKEDAEKTARDIEAFLLSKAPFPTKDFGFKLDAEIKAMFFFPIDAEKKEYKKKNYVYVTSKDKVKILGLPIIKSNASRVATRILDKYLLPQIKEKLDIKFNRGYLQQLMYFELEQDLGLSAQTYKIRDIEYYKNESGLHAQIAKRYGPGTIELVTNARFGVGKDKKYCTIEEFRNNKLSVADVDLSVAWNNLDPFIKESQTGLSSFLTTE